jgi:hypothetical protein
MHYYILNDFSVHMGFFLSHYLLSKESILEMANSDYLFTVTNVQTQKDP